MKDRHAFMGVGAARIVASTFGTLAGLGGILHGVGETLQGNVVPEGLFIDSWTQGPIATNMGGDPGLTIVPNLLVTGILCITVSLATVIWAAGFVQREHGGTVLIVLSIAMLLLGGGVGPPIIGILAGIAAITIHAPLTWWRTHLSANLQHLLAQGFPYVFGITLLNGLFLFVGALFLVYFWNWGDADLYLNSFLFAVLSLPVTIVTAIAYDIQATTRAVPAYS